MAGFLAPDIAGRVSQHMKLTSASVLIAIAWIAGAQAAECPRPGTLGTSRVLSVDAASTPRVGLKSFPQTLPLAEHEVVLTFDDGPWPATTSRVLATLAQECVRATFFMIGKNAAEHPNLVRRIADEGHTIGHHTWSHRSQMRIKPGETTAEIDRGISAVEMALHGVESATPSTLPNASSHSSKRSDTASPSRRQRPPEPYFLSVQARPRRLRR